MQQSLLRLLRIRGSLPRKFQSHGVGLISNVVRVGVSNAMFFVQVSDASRVAIRVEFEVHFLKIS